MDVYQLAEERGFAVAETQVGLEHRRTRLGWLVYDLALQVFVPDAVNWTTPAQVMEYIEGASGG